MLNQLSRPRKWGRGAAEARFEFGKNWLRFAQSLDESQIQAAERSLTSMLGLPSLKGMSFLDVGCGSGLFSLAAVRLGAASVVSLDYDASSVRCTEELHRRYANDVETWVVERGDATDSVYLQSLGAFSLVYAWGSLHHTGEMWRAIDNTCAAVAPGGYLFLSIYNDQGLMSSVWRTIKWTYNRLPPPLRIPYAALVILLLEARAAVGHAVKLEPHKYLRKWLRGRRNRGMSRWHDLLDWVGGYPFEVARPEEVFDFCRGRGFELTKLRTSGGLGCNQYVFVRSRDVDHTRDSKKVLR